MAVLGAQVIKLVWIHDTQLALPLLTLAILATNTTTVILVGTIQHACGVERTKLADQNLKLQVHACLL